MKIALDVKKITVLINRIGTDEVDLTLNAPSPFPSMGYEGHATIQVAKGHGAEWCRNVIGVEPEIIDAKGT